MYLDKFKDPETGEVIQTKIYSTEELLSMEPTQKLIDYFISSESLYLSMVVNMFKFCNISQDDAEILNICRTNPNFYKDYTWTKEQRAEFEHIYTELFKKWLAFKTTYEAFYELSVWNAMGTAFNLVDYSPEYYQEYLKLVDDLNVDDEEDNKKETSKVNVINVSQ